METTMTSIIDVADTLTTNISTSTPIDAVSSIVVADVSTMGTSVATAASIATIAASIIAALALFVSSYIFVQSSRRDRRIKTLDYWESVQPSLVEARKILSNLHDGEWTKEIAFKHLNSSQNRGHIMKGLSSFERLAIGINLDVYDLSVIGKLAGEMIVNSYVVYAPLIAAMEEQEGKAGLYKEFTLVYVRLERICIKSP